MFDLSPLYRSTVGFDRLAQLLDNVGSFEVPAYPPYNIERVGEDEYRVTMAVAGFGQDDIAVEVKQNTLTVSGKKADKTESKGEFLHQGIAQPLAAMGGRHEHAADAGRLALRLPEPRIGGRLAVDQQPQVQGRHVLAVEFGIGAGLFHDENVHAQPEQRVEFGGGEFLQPPDIDTVGGRRHQ